MSLVSFTLRSMMTVQENLNARHEEERQKVKTTLTNAAQARLECKKEMALSQQKASEISKHSAEIFNSVQADLQKQFDAVDQELKILNQQRQSNNQTINNLSKKINNG